MATREIYSYVNTQANLKTLLQPQMRGIDTDTGENWSYKDDGGVFHVTANQKKWSGGAWVYEDNSFGKVYVHDISGATGSDYIVTRDNSTGQLQQRVWDDFASDHSVLVGLGATDRVAFWSADRTLSSDSVFTFSSSRLSVPQVSLSGNIAIGGATYSSVQGIALTQSGGASNSAYGGKFDITYTGTLTGTRVNYGLQINQTHELITDGNNSSFYGVSIVPTITTSLTAMIGYYAGMSLSVDVSDFHGYRTFFDFSGTSGRTVGSAYGVYNRIINNSSGTMNNAYGSYTIIENDDGLMSNAYGHYVVINQDLAGGQLTASYGYSVYVDRDAGTHVDSYLFHGVYDGTITNKYGLWLSGDSLNKVDGSLGIGASPSYKLDAQLESSATDSIQTVARLGYSSTGTVASGIGSRLDFSSELPTYVSSLVVNGGVGAYCKSGVSGEASRGVVVLQYAPGSATLANALVAGYYDSDTEATVFSRLRLRYPGTFGQLYTSDGSSATSVATGSNYTLIPFGTAGSYSETTVSAANGITVNRAGYYLIEFSMSFTLGTNNVVCRFAVFNGSNEIDDVHSAVKIGTGSDFASTGSSGIVSLSAGSVITLKMRHDNGSSVNITPVYASMCVTYIGEALS